MTRGLGPRRRTNGTGNLLVLRGAARVDTESESASGSVEYKQHQTALAEADTVIGMPANDGTPDGCYLVLTLGSKRIAANWHRLSYDCQTTRDAMAPGGLSLL